MITTVLAFLLTLGVLIVVHEYGHYRVAVACGVKVLRFSVGFGRVLWRRCSGPDRTEFTICALPLGGYVKMLDEREGPVRPEELHRAFNRQGLWPRVAIVAAGPLANLALAVLLYAAVNWVGVREPQALVSAPVAGSALEAAGLRSGDWVRACSTEPGSWTEVRSLPDLRWMLTQAALEHRAVQLQVSDRDGRGQRMLQVDLSRISAQEVDANFLRAVGLGAAYSEPLLGELKPGGPALRAGLMAGDRVLAVDERPVLDAQELRERIRASHREGQPVAQKWRVQRAGQTLELEVLPRIAEDNGRSVARIDALVGGPYEWVLVRHGFVEGLWLGATRTWEVGTLTLRMLGRMLIGEASLKNLSGPITIADLAGQSIEKGLAYYLGFLAVVSVGLGVLNLLPVPMLDGGHLMYYLFEGVLGRPISEAWMIRLQYCGVAILLLMMSVALFNDVARQFGWH